MLSRVVQSGVYTPTLTNVTNVAASTAFQCQWIRVGNVVTVSGKVNIDPTAGAPTASELGMSLPIASNFGAAEDCGGVAAANAVQQCIAIGADLTNDRAQFTWSATDTTNRVFHFTFSYRILP